VPLPLPCGHTATVACGTRNQLPKCSQQCLRRLKCSHQCTQQCSEFCDDSRCPACARERQAAQAKAQSEARARHLKDMEDAKKKGFDLQPALRSDQSCLICGVSEDAVTSPRW
jgi:hypothetical protein